MNKVKDYRAAISDRDDWWDADDKLIWQQREAELALTRAKTAFLSSVKEKDLATLEALIISLGDTKNKTSNVARGDDDYDE